jgi:hypothetical protein
MRYCHKLYNKPMLSFHIFVALTSVLFSSYLTFQPSVKGLKTSYFLVAITLTSGTYLALSTRSNLISVCISGLVYTAIVSIGILTAHHRLAEAQKDS